MLICVIHALVSNEPPDNQNHSFFCTLSEKGPAHLNVDGDDASGGEQSLDSDVGDLIEQLMEKRSVLLSKRHFAVIISVKNLPTQESHDVGATHCASGADLRFGVIRFQCFAILHDAMAAILSSRASCTNGPTRLISRRAYHVSILCPLSSSSFYHPVRVSAHVHRFYAMMTSAFCIFLLMTSPL